MAKFQDDNGPVGALAIFHDGRKICAAPGDQGLADDLRNRMNANYPRCEVLACCNAHPDVAAVDCLICWPLEVSA